MIRPAPSCATVIENISLSPTRNWRRRNDGALEMLCGWGDHDAMMFLLVIEDQRGHLAPDPRRGWTWSIHRLKTPHTEFVARGFGELKRSDAQKRAVETLVNIVREILKKRAS